MNNKRGVSGVVVTVLLVLISIAAIAIIGTVTLSFIRTNTEKIEAGVSQVNIQIEKNSVKYSPTAIELKVTRQGAGNISGINIILESEDGKSYSYKYEQPILELETKTISIPSQNFEEKISGVVKITAVPLVKTKSGSSFAGTPSEPYVPGKEVLNIQQGLILYLPFDSDVKDYSGLTNDPLTCVTSTPATCPTNVQGKINKAYYFDGTDDVLNLNSISNDLSNTNGAVMAWVYPIQIGTNTYVFVSSLNGRTYLQYNAGSFNTVKGDPGNATTLIANAPLNNWYHIALTWDSTTMKSYLNGKLIEIKSFATTPSIGAYWRIGTQSAAYINANIDELRFYNRSLGSEEIYQIYKLS